MIGFLEATMNREDIIERWFQRFGWFGNYESNTTHDMPPDDNIDLGPCCACGKKDATVRNLVMLNKKSPIPGHGWGCFVCHLPCDGANAVICDHCADINAEIKFAWKGYSTDGLIPIANLDGEHKHDLAFHPETWKCKICGCTQDRACVLPNDRTCHWINPELCSGCAKFIVYPSDMTFTNSPDEGDPDCLCSRCLKVIPENEIALRAWPESGAYELRYHNACVGMTTLRTEFAEDEY